VKFCILATEKREALATCINAFFGKKNGTLYEEFLLNSPDLESRF
jgi:hypothetical protein